MANLISLNITKRTVGGESFIKNLFGGTKNSTSYSPAVTRGFDTKNIIGPIRNDGQNTYFTTREWTGMETSSRIDHQISWISSDALSVIVGKSNNFVLLTVLFEDEVRKVDMKSELMVFNINKMMTGMGLIPDPVNGGTIFQYIEEGNPNPIQYTVLETISQIIAQGIPPVVLMNGWEFYVNDLIGNDSTAQPGTPDMPYATFDAAMTAAKVNGQGVIIITGDRIGNTNNAFSPFIDIEIKGEAEFILGAYVASGQGNQTIYGKGYLLLSSDMTADATFSGEIKIDVGRLSVGQSNTQAFVNNTTTTGSIDVSCDYFHTAAPSVVYSVTGTAPKGSFIVRNQYVDGSWPGSGGNTPCIGTILINPTTTSVGNKYFTFKIAGGNNFSSNEGIICLSNTDSTYFVDADITIDFDGSKGAPALNAVLVCDGCTGGRILLKGTHNLITQGRCAIVLNSAVNVLDYSTTINKNLNPNPIIQLSGGTSTYTMYGKKLANNNTSSGSIQMGVTFTASSPTQDLGTPTGTAGTDTLHFKGAMKCTWANNSAVGVGVANGNPNLIMDGGVIEMVQSDTLCSSIKGTAQNMKVYNSGYVRGAITGMTNTITGGANIIDDAGVIAAIQ